MGKRDAADWPVGPTPTDRNAMMPAASAGTPSLRANVANGVGPMRTGRPSRTLATTTSSASSGVIPRSTASEPTRPASTTCSASQPRSLANASQYAQPAWVSLGRVACKSPRERHVVARQWPDAKHRRRDRDDPWHSAQREAVEPLMRTIPGQPVLLAQRGRQEAGGDDLQGNEERSGQAQDSRPHDQPPQLERLQADPNGPVRQHAFDVRLKVAEPLGEAVLGNAEQRAEE